MKEILTYCCFLLLLISCKEKEGSANSEEPSIVEKIALANGIEHFDEVTELQYTFNVKVNDTLRTSRNWIWKPKTGQVILSTEDSTVSYNSKTEARKHQEVDQKFINDQYWLLFPFHLVWDEMNYKHDSKSLAPISGDTLQKVVVEYPADAGYTPGDVYEVHFGDDFLIREWVYRSGGSTENPFSATWGQYRIYNGINISTRHKNKDGTFELFFTDVKIVNKAEE